MKAGKISISAIALFLTMFLVVYINFNTSYWNDKTRVISNDIISYYAYLPATFIYDDFTLSFMNTRPDDYGSKFWPKITPTGKYVIITSCGMSMLYFPFFIVAHPIAQYLGYEANGFSAPYKFAIILSSMVYLFIGLIFMRKLLLKYFSEPVTALTIIGIMTGTNLLWYATVEAAMTHVFSFSLISVFMYYADVWLNKTTLRLTLWLGLLAGIISLVRPTNVVVLLILLLWKVTTLSEFKERLLLFLKNWYLVLAMAGVFFMVWIPQFLYWKAVAGQYLYFSYPDSNHFYFGNPQFFNTMFSWRKGWLIYIPLMWLMLAGIGLMYKEKREFFWPVLVYFLVSWYVISSWWDWWYGGGFSIRPYIDSSSVFAFGIAAFLTFIFKQGKWIKKAGMVLFVLLTLIGATHHTKYFFGSIHWDSMTRKAYFDSLFRLRPSESFYSKIRSPDYESARKGIYRYMDEATEIENSPQNNPSE